MDVRNQYYRSAVGEANIANTENPLAVNCVGSVLSDEGFYNNNVRRDFYLIYVTEGEFGISLDEKAGVIKKGTAVIIKPGTRFVYRAEKGMCTEYLWIHFTGKDAERLLEMLTVPVNEFLDVGVHMTLKELWQRLYREFILLDKLFDATTMSILMYILSNLGRYINSSGNRLIKSVEYINLHYKEEIKISDMAKKENMSESTFRNLFYAATGFRPNEYIQKVRVNAAAALLESTDKKLSEIASLVGFYDEYYFGRVFKKRAGMSPGAYRKMIKDRNRDFR